MKPTDPPGEAAVFHQEQTAIQQAQAALADPDLQQSPWAVPFAHLLQSYEKLWTQTQRIMRMSDRFQGQLQAAKQAEARAEEGLAEALSRLRKIAQQVPGVIFQYRLRANGSACFPYASDGLQELFRISPAEASQTAATVWGKLHPLDFDDTLASIRKSARDLTPWHHEFRVRFADATVRWLLGNALPQREADGSTLWHGFITDVTVRKQAEEALRESEEKLKDMVDTLPLAIHLTTGVEQVTHYVNRTMVKLFGYPRKDLPSIKEWWPLAFPDETYRREVSEEWNRRVRLAIDTQSPIEPMEVVVTCKDGTKKNISWAFITLGDKNYSCGLDLTARKQAEAALGAERWRLRHLFEHSPVATWLEDFTALNQWMEQLRAQGVTDLAAFLREQPAQVSHALGLIRVLDMNPAAVFQNAAQSKQHLRESLPLLFNERTYADFTAELVALWQGQFNFEYESHGRRLDGRLLVALVRLDVPLQDGQPDFSQVIVTGTDITERKQAEARLAEILEQTQRKAETKAALLQEVNHRVENDLLAILDLALTEQRQLTAGEQPAAQRFTAHLRRRVEVLLEVHRLLSASQWAPLLVNQLAQKIIQSVLATAPGSCPVKLTLQPSTVKVMPRQAGNLALIFNELATNTVKHALARRAAAQVTFSATATAGHSRLEYRDDGPGYPPEVLRQERLSVGLTLVRDLTTEPLHGQLTLANESGAVTVLEIQAQETDRT